jgi:hypothetical protein
MALMNKNREVTPGELRLFGVLQLVVLGLIGGIVLHRTGSWTLATVVWTVTLLLCSFYYAMPTAQHMVFQTWMTLVYPIGWIISHTLLAMLFYVVITPIGWLLRLCNHDLLQKKLDRSTRTYWTSHNTREDIKRYFQQF